MTAPLWTPSAERIAAANTTRFRAAAEARWSVALPDSRALWRFSVNEREKFWTSIIEFADLKAETWGDKVLVDGDKLPGAKWFPDARLNFAQNLLKQRGTGDAIVFRGEDKVRRRVSHNELHEKVSRLAQALKAEGVGIGDKVGAYIANMPEAIIGMLATASLGATWSSCSPDFGTDGVLDRFGQIEPKVVIAVDGYFYNGKTLDIHPKLEAIVKQLPSVRRVVVVPYASETPDISAIPNAERFDDFIGPFAERELDYAQVPFDHPLYILYSSGTTGKPKCIVHSTGGTLLKHASEHLLASDVKPGDRVFWFTTCGWMMWNWLVSGLASGATLLLYDGSPFVSKGSVLWDYAAEEKMTVFGTSAKYIDALAKLRMEPGRTHDLSSLRALLSTGSPLVPESFDYVYRSIKPDLQLASISGGTDIISCFALGCPTLPVWRGELQCRGLGMKIEVWNDEGRPVLGEKGELVCTAPFPSMPVGFWNDADGAKYRAAYFERYPGIWHHGDYVELTEHDGLMIFGRSDAVLNPGGVRIGTAEIYRQVERLDEVVESLAIGQDWPPQQPNDVRVVLFVRLRDGLTLTAELVDRIKRQIRDNTTPRHVPAAVVQVSDIPRTKSGKIVELAVRNIVHGHPVKNLEALANPEALAQFGNREELRG